MSDKELIETIKRIKRRCIEKDNCISCSFFLIESGRCQFEWLGRSLSTIPYKWDIEKIEDIICK